MLLYFIDEVRLTNKDIANSRKSDGSGTEMVSYNSNDLNSEETNWSESSSDSDGTDYYGLYGRYGFYPGRCPNCGERGHDAYRCPESSEAESE